MAFHLIKQESYSFRTVPCGPQCNKMCILSNPPEHRQDYTFAMCGREMIRYQDNYCNAGIARPQWNNDWCIECINTVQWDEEDTRILRGKDLLLERKEDTTAIGFISKIRQTPPEGRHEAWELPLSHARLGFLKGLPQPLINWFEEAVAHLDDGGPRPAYWPEDNPWQEE